MKPLLAESQDVQSLQALGRASVQIVHDLKNQLNGLKLYATFLKKRLEKSERPADELETITKLIRGLDRTADDLSMIVQFGQPLAVKRQPGVSLQKVFHNVVVALNEAPKVSGALNGQVVIDSETGPLVGEFDSELLTDAIKWTSMGAMKLLSNRSKVEPLRVRLSERADSSRQGLITWLGFEFLEHNPFQSFAGSDELRMSLAAKVIEAHGGSAELRNGTLQVSLPLEQIR